MKILKPILSCSAISLATAFGFQAAAQTPSAPKFRPNTDLKLDQLKKPVLKKPGLTHPSLSLVSGILYENNCRVDYEFRIYNSQTCATTRVFVKNTEAARLCARLPGHLEPVTVNVDTSVNSRHGEVLAKSISGQTRRSMRGVLTEVNTVDREARVRMDQCGQQAVARIFFTQQEVGQLRGKRARQHVTVSGQFRATNENRGDRWVVTHPTLR